MKLIKDKRIQAVIDVIGAVTLNLWIWLAPETLQAVFKSAEAVVIIQIFGIIALIVFGYALIRICK